MNMSKQYRFGEMRFIVNLQWKESTNPWGALSYYDDDELKTLSFSNIVELLFKMDCVCDEQGHPQRDTVLRSLQKPKKATPHEAEEKNTKQYGCEQLAVPIVICMRQHSSMQGYIQIRDGKHFFRSEMEFMKLLCEIMAIGKKNIAKVRCNQ